VLAVAGSLANLPTLVSLPDVIPDPPEAPIPLESKVAGSLAESTLSPAQQRGIIFDLENLHGNSNTRTSALTLLHRFYDRDDLTNEVGNKIRALLSDVSESSPRGKKQRTIDQPSARKKSNLTQLRTLASKLTLEPFWNNKFVTGVSDEKMVCALYSRFNPNPFAGGAVVIGTDKGHILWFNLVSGEELSNQWCTGLKGKFSNTHLEGWLVRMQAVK